MVLSMLRRYSKHASRRVGRSCAVGLIVALAVCGFASLAAAGPGQRTFTPPSGSVAADQSKAYEGVVFYPAPPAGFNPLTASAAELAHYGYPPEPPKTAPDAYKQWQKLVTYPAKRITNPKLQLTTIYNGPLQKVSEGQTVDNQTGVNSLNWSGWATVNSSNPFATNDAYIQAEFAVPVAQEAFFSCNDTWDYSAYWVGFDGFNNSDVLQAGIEADAACLWYPYGFSEYFDSAWFEWYPYAETRIDYPIINPGDLMGVTVWYTTSSPHGIAYIVDYTDQQATVIGFNPPSGTTYVGNSAEWVVERPTVNGALADLTNYTANPWDFAYAYGNGNYYYGTSSPSGTTAYDIYMYCNSSTWYPSSDCPSATYISYPEFWSPYLFWFYDTGPAWVS